MLRITRAGSITLALMLASVAQGADFEQLYYRQSDGSVLLKIGMDGSLVKHSDVAWDQKESPSGAVYYECRYQATDGTSAIVSDQLLWYFPREPSNGNSHASKYWVYWYNIKTEVTWGRCPTPHHPDYAVWRDAKGEDLWQVVPRDDRPALKGVGNLFTIGEAMAPEIIGGSDETMPKVSPDTGDDTIYCVDFGNTIFL